MNKRYKLSLLLAVSLAGVLGALAWIGSLAWAARAATAAAMTVDTLEDELNSDGDCSLREAIEAANTNLPVDTCPAGSGVITDTIGFSVAGAITVTSQLSVSVGGPLVIDGGQEITVSGGGAVRVLYVNGGADLSIRGLTVTRGHVGFYDSFGGGIRNEGQLLIVDSAITDNSAGGCSLDVGCSGAGGGIYNSGTLEIDRSLINSNYSPDHGGGIFNSGTLVIEHSVIKDNRSHGFMGNGRGGGIFNSGVLTIANSTIAGNRSLAAQIAPRGGIHIASGSVTIINSSIIGNIRGNIVNDGTSTMTNTIVAYPVSGVNCRGAPVIDGGHNLEDSDACGFDPAKGTMINTDPRLGPLQDNGGPTWTQALLAGSPAIDAGDDVACPPTDQRGVARPQDGDWNGTSVCDIGAYEFEQAVDLYPFQQTGSGLPGDTVTYTLGLFNYTPLTDTYTLETGGNTWSADLSASLIGPLTPVSSGSFTVSVTIPAEAHLGMTDTLVISATSQTSPTVFAANGRITTIAQAQSSTAILSDLPDPSLAGQHFTTTFTVASTWGIPTGTVTVRVADRQEGCDSPLTDGHGQCSLALTDPGVYTLNATYNGGVGFLPSSDTETHTVIVLDKYLYLPTILRLFSR